MDPLFLAIATVTIGSALAVVSRRNPVYAAVWLLVCFLTFAVVYLMLSAAFLAMIHVLVYTGAILVLFVFVIMLLNLSEEELGEEYPLSAKAMAAVLSVGLFVMTAVPILRDSSLAVPLPDPNWRPAGSPVPLRADEFGEVASVGRLLFKDYALPFELVSVLIIVAMFGSMVLAKKTLWTKPS